MDTPAEITLFIVPDSLGAQLKARYVCLTSTERHAGGEQRWYTEHSIVEIAKQIDPGLKLDWSILEEELAENGVYKGS